MINVTLEAAAQILASARQTAGGEVYLRLAAHLDGNGVIEYGMGLDDKSEGDLLTESQGIRVLVSAGCAELLTGATLDFVEINPGEKQFIFINPNDPSHTLPAADDSTRVGRGPATRV
jgi:iron-sulfur cluster assembly protein